MRVLLIDADIPLYRIAHSHQENFCWDENTWAVHGDLRGAKDAYLQWIEHLKKYLDAPAVSLYLSDTKVNWRHAVYADYKGNRAAWSMVQRRQTFEDFGAPLLPPKPGPQRPILHKPMRDWILQEIYATVVPTLEGDDCCGMAATSPAPFEGGLFERIIVSSDKDLKQIPGRLYNPDDPSDVVSISVEEADYFHLLQTLTGDRTDNYPGCKGLGDVKARKLFDKKGATWDTVVEAYCSAGLTEADALAQARVARVCRWNDYDCEKGEVKLWTPR
jgi:DNA polymerase-1